MNYEEYVQQGLDGEYPLKLILCGKTEEVEQSGISSNDSTEKSTEKSVETIGVVSVVFATESKELAAKKLRQFAEEHPAHYYMVYSVPMDMDLTALSHYPSIAITKADLA